MKMWSKRGKRSVSVFLIIGLCYVYAFLALGGMKRISGDGRQDWKETAFSINGDKLECRLLQDQTIVLDISGMSEKQETVRLQYYQENGQMICEKTHVLRNGGNDLGKIKKDAAYIIYIGRKNVTGQICHIYQGVGSVFSWGTFWYVGSGIAALAFMQCTVVYIKKKYAG